MRSGWVRGRGPLPSRAMREVAALLTVCVAAGLAMGAGLHTLLHRQSTPAHAGAIAGQPDCSVMLFGDSILYGAHNGVQRLDDPPAALLQRLRPRYEVLDHSPPGDSAHRHAPHFARTPLRGRIVVLQFGINDAGQNTPYEAAMRAMVQRVRAQGGTPVITGLSRVSAGRPQRDAYDRTARRIAHSTGTAFADWGAVPLATADMADDVHPGQPYAERLTRQLVQALDQVAPECAQGLPTPATLRMAALHRMDWADSDARLVELAQARPLPDSTHLTHLTQLAQLAPLTKGCSSCQISATSVPTMRRPAVDASALIARASLERTE